MTIEISSLIDCAIERTGLHDLGDSSYQAPLERLVASLNTETELNATGNYVATNILVDALVNRLKIEDYWKRHPQLEEQVVARPVIIIGMSRSGTTALSHLLAKDPSFRSLLAWEAKDSVPPPKAETYWTDPRYLAAVEADRNTVPSKIRALHYDPPNAPVECNALFNMTFQSTAISTVFYVPSFLRWMMTADTAYLYDYHARMLKLLQSETPGRWVLKAPQHALDPEQLRAHYPDATFVITHRDPAACVGSSASLFSTLNDVMSGVHRPRELGALAAEFFDHKAERLIAFARDHEESVVNVPYERLIADPMGAVRQVLDAAGHELQPDAEAAISAHINEKPQHSHGVHRYDIADFGLDRRALHERYADYIEAFGIPTV